MKSLLFSAVLFLSLSAFADTVENTSILESIDDMGGASIVVASDIPLEFTAQDSSGYYHLKNDIFWQAGVRFTDVTALKLDQDFCSMKLSTFATIDAIPAAAIKAKDYISSSITGRISDLGGFTTKVNLDDDNSYSSFTNPLNFYCVTPKTSAHEITPNQIKNITGGAVGIKFGLYILGNQTTAVIAQMLIENARGYRMFKAAHKIGPVIETTKIEEVSSQTTGRITTSVDKYTILSRDCLGTDACKGMIEWIVTATTTSDGYSWETTFVNDVHKK